MFVLTALVYPGVLAALCIAAGLLVDRASGGFLPGLTLAPVGAGALIAVSQLTTYAAPLAPATPYVLAAIAAVGFALGWRRLAALASGWRARRWQLALPLLAYLIALAPVLAAGRPTFTSYMSLTDSALHMVGADYLIHHGQAYSHLDLRNSYGELINAYFNAGYPSGAHTLFGASALLLRLPLIWAFQPFNAFMLAIAAGPAWVLVRRMGLTGGWAALGALSATVPALVYGYELVGSIKEITALPMILALGALVTVHRDWMARPRRALAFAVLTAGGVSALGVAFGAWVLVTVAVLIVPATGDLRARVLTPRRSLLAVALAAGVAVLGAWPTWINVSGSVQVARGVAATTNPGNLKAPLKLTQVFGSWWSDTYLRAPVGRDLALTDALIAVALVSALVGAVHLVRIRAYALAGWLGLMVALGLALSAYGTSWTDAKILMLSSPVVVLSAWAGVGAMRAAPLRVAAPALALLLAGGVLVSDARQYHSTNLAPTARYREMASLDGHFAGRGPTLFTDFDEYSQYVLRDLDVSGPDFTYAPAALRRISPHHGSLVILDRIPPGVLRAFPLIITRRDPTASRPPAAYRLLWQGSYYQLWARRPGAAVAIEHVGFSPATPVACSQVQPLAQIARSHGARLVAATAVPLVRINVLSAARPAPWSPGAATVQGVVMRGPGQLRAAFAAPHAGRWDVWLQGAIMRPVHVSVDSRSVGSIGGQVGGKKYIFQTMTPLGVRLSAGRHLLAVTRGGFSLAPGDGGSAILEAVFLTPSGAAGQQALRVLPAGRWRSLCGQRLNWIEVLPS